MKPTSLVAAALVLVAASARAQETLPQSQPSVPPGATAPRPGVPTPAPAPNLQRIYHIRQLEGMLTNAVKAGATSLANQLKIAEPNSAFVTGNARTRGFELEGYGVFFDVDVPTMMQSVLWSTQLLQQQQYVDNLRRKLADPALDPAIRNMAQVEVTRVERAMARGQIVTVPSGPPVPEDQPRKGVVEGTTTTDSVVAVGARNEVAPGPPRSPDELYTETIKGALIDAMLSYGNALQLGDNEWLTIAARASSQVTPGQLDDSSSILIRVKGSDLSAFLRGNLSREEIMKKIEIKEG